MWRIRFGLSSPVGCHAGRGRFRNPGMRRCPSGLLEFPVARGGVLTKEMTRPDDVGASSPFGRRQLDRSGRPGPGSTTGGPEPAFILPAPTPSPAEPGRGLKQYRQPVGLPRCIRLLAPPTGVDQSSGAGDPTALGHRRLFRAFFPSGLGPCRVLPEGPESSTGDPFAGGGLTPGDAVFRPTGPAPINLSFSQCAHFYSGANTTNKPQLKLAELRGKGGVPRATTCRTRSWSPRHGGLKNCGRSSPWSRRSTLDVGPHSVIPSLWR